MDITVAIPTIPSRSGRLRQAISSVAIQTQPARALSIAVDTTKDGSAATRNRALNAVQTEWVAFLDDDDQFLPNHLELLARGAEKTGADVVYGLPRVLDANKNVVPRHWTWGGPEVFSPDILRVQSYITVSSLVRTELAQQVGGFEFHRSANGQYNDDHGFYVRLLDAGADFHHIHTETFLWNHHGGNTSGRPDKGDARV